MSIKITFTGGTPLEALADLTAFGIMYMSNPDVAAAANRIFRDGKRREDRLEAEAERSSPTPAPVPEPYTEGTPFEGAEPDAGDAHGPDAGDTKRDTGTEPVKAPALEEVRAAGIQASRKFGQAAVKAVLERFGAPNMTGLKEADRAAFVEALKGLGDGDA